MCSREEALLKVPKVGKLINSAVCHFTQCSVSNAPAPVGLAIGLPATASCSFSANLYILHYITANTHTHTNIRWLNANTLANCWRFGKVFSIARRMSFFARAHSQRWLPSVVCFSCSSSHFCRFLRSTHFRYFASHSWSARFERHLRLHLPLQCPT